MDFLIKYHESLLKDFHEAERNFISIIAAIIGSMGVFGVGLKAYLDQPCIQNTIFFTITTSGAILLQIVVIYISNIKAYSCRTFQIVLSRIENCIEKMTNGEISGNIAPQNWNLYERLKKCDPVEHPEIFLFFKWLACIIIILIVVLYVAIITDFFNSFEKISILGINLLFFVLVLAFVVIVPILQCRFGWLSCFGWPSYADKLKDLCKNVSQCRFGWSSYANKLKDLCKDYNLKTSQNCSNTKTGEQK